jgi:glutathione reductase (NADPH)
MSHDVDLFVIGGGSGGVRAARMAAGHGAKVALAEEQRLGGTCVNVGCIPKKLLVYASHFAEDFADAAGFGWSLAKPRFDWAQLIANKDLEITRLNGVYARLLDEAGVERIAGRARLVGPHEVLVGDRRVRARYVLVAVGGRPRAPHIPGGALAISSNEAFQLPRLPERVLVVGGGYIAVEFAGIFHGLGAHVTLVHRGEVFLRGFDDDVRIHLASEMRRRGVALRFGAEVEELTRAPGGIVARLSNGSTLEVDVVLCAIGRVPNTEGLGLGDAGVATRADGSIIVDAFSCTNVPSVYAVGDVTERKNLTPVAIAEGAAVAATLFGGRPTEPDHRDVPSAVFSQPEIGTVGLTETEARGRYGEIDVYRSTFRPLRHTLSGRGERTLMKLVVERASQRVVGCHVVGPSAAEIVQGFAVAVKMGATKAQLDATIGIHPTAAEELVTMRVAGVPLALQPE